MPSLPLALPVDAAPPAAWAPVLDEPAAWQEFSRPVPGSEGRWESYIAIEGMYCAACTLTIEQAIGQLPGVESVQVNGSTATARVVWSPQRSQPSRLVARAGASRLPRPSGG